MNFIKVIEAINAEIEPLEIESIRIPDLEVIIKSKKYNLVSNIQFTNNLEYYIPLNCLTEIKVDGVIYYVFEQPQNE